MPWCRAAGAELHLILSSLRDDAAAHPAVAQAMRVGVALHVDDTTRVLAELPHLYYHGVCLLRPQLPRLRERALHGLCHAYLPSLPLGVLARRLGWDDDLRGCVQFLRSLGTVPAMASGRAEPELDTKAALHTLAQRAAAARAEAEQQLLVEQQGRQGQRVAPPWEVGPAVPHEFLGGMDW